MMGEATIVFATQATTAGCPICPDFLRRLVALIHSMRLSLMKGAHADLSSTAWQEIGVKPSFGFEWDAQDLTPQQFTSSPNNAHVS
jgi:hypothetical protein